MKENEKQNIQNAKKKEREKNPQYKYISILKMCPNENE